MNHRVDDNPWKGLDSYQESDRLFGRDEEIEILFSRIEYNRQTVVYSRSGIGKSSIINAGIFPKARNAGMLPVAIRLQHTTQKDQPTTPYIEQIRQAVESALKAAGGRIEELVPHKPGHKETLWEYLHRYRFWLSDDNSQRVVPLLVFDQFEEIFTLEKDPHRVTEFFAEVADLLNGIMPDYLTETHASAVANENIAVNRTSLFKGLRERQKSNTPEYLHEDLFHIVFTMREDYLSYLERNTAYIPSLKLNRYCLLPINEEQAASIIMDPRPGLVDIDVAKLIIEKITGETDFEFDGHPAISVDSAILSLYLSRLYLMLPEGADKITAELVNKFGDNIIQDFYLEAIEDISPSSVEYLEDNLLNNEGRRENVSVYNAQHIGGLTDTELHKLCEERKLLRRFAYGGDMRIEYIHDILCSAIQERRDLRQMLKTQEEERRQLLEHEQRKRERLEQKARADRRRYRQWLTAGAAALILILGSWVYHQWMDVWQCNEYYTNFIQINGWPVGVGEELSEREAMSRCVCFKLTKKGHRAGTPFRDVEVMTPDGLLHNNRGNQLVDVGESQDRKAKMFKFLMNSTKYYHFSSTETGDSAKVTKMEALDKNHHTLYVVNYFSNTDDTDVAVSDEGDNASSYVWAVYTDSKGAPLQMLDNGADRIQVFLTDDGREEKYMFYDESRAPRQNDMGYYGYRVHYDALNNTDSIWILDPFSTEEFMEVRSYTRDRDEFRCHALDGHSINHQTLGYHKRVVCRDERGNMIHKEYFDASGSHVSNAVRSSFVDLQYDELNRMTVTDDYDNDMKPYTQNPHFYPHREFTYIGNTLEPLSEHDYRWDEAQQKMVLVRKKDTRLFGSVTEYIYHNIEKGEYRMRRVENNEDMEPISISYYDINDQPMFDSTENFHKHITEQRIMPNGQKIVVHRYYDIDGSLYSNPHSRKFAIDSCLYSKRNLLLSRVCYDQDTNIVSSQGYEYKDGVEVARYARGINGQPIRCPAWEQDGLSYYLLYYVKAANNQMSYVRPVNEYQCPTYAYNPSDTLPHDAHPVVYIHLTHHSSAAQHIGLHDGDLLLSIGNWQYTITPSAAAAQNEWNNIGLKHLTLKVARYDQSSRTWAILTFELPQLSKPFRCEIYPIYYTDEEYQIFSSALSQLTNQ
ncbi:MAG: hypothetical protein J5486_02235 [Bacteroidaceae bacterium]|nr:hypothetical protein [Bacteroidaceae bacterium]